MNELEILAPCGDYESFTTAISNGADAVYLGLGDFNARAKSVYFNAQNIRETVIFAHLRGVKVYVTVNTLVKNEELPTFLQLIKACVNAKVDAYIVQDFGCAYLLKNLFPNIVLHASTQMGIHNADGAKLAKKLGFKRVVVSRETKLHDILEIKKETGLEIEYFVQGALCVAFSGNCYFSALSKGQSGNRGKCLQLCRLPYTAILKNKEVAKGYLLSVRDLCLIDNLQKLIDAGVCSFKIEGRLRRAGYVGQAVNSFKNALNSIKNKQKTDINAEKTKLKKVFSRGEYNYNAYLNDGVPDDIINISNQNHIGIKIGRVEHVEQFKNLHKVEISSTHVLSCGDGLKFLDDENKETDSLGVGNVERKGANYVIYTKHKLTPNLNVYLTLNSSLENSLKNKQKLINLEINFTTQINSPFEINISQKNNLLHSFESEYVCQEAKSSPTTKEEIIELFKTLDVSLFYIENININLDNVFIPKSALKDARRQCAVATRQTLLSDCESHILASILPNFNTKWQKIATSPQIPSPQYNNIIFVDEKLDFQNYSILLHDLICLFPTYFDKNFILSKLKELSKITKNIGLVLPTIANGKDMIILDEIVQALPHIPLIVNNLYGLKYAESNYLIAGTDLNIYNNFSFKCLNEFGLKEAIFSKEILSENSNFYQYAYGYHELMHFCHCPYKTIFKNTCKNCSYSSNLCFLSANGEKFNIHRTKISQCYFTMFSNNLTNRLNNFSHKLIDLRK